MVDAAKMLQSSEAKKIKTADGKSVDSNNQAMKDARKNIFDKTMANGHAMKKIDPTTFGALNGAAGSFFSDLEKEPAKPPTPPKPTPKPG